jgi:hypothetical protein
VIGNGVTAVPTRLTGADIKTTMEYYVHIPEEFEKEAIEKLSAFRKDDRQVTVQQKRGRQ